MLHKKKFLKVALALALALLTLLSDLQYLMPGSVGDVKAWGTGNGASGSVGSGGGGAACGKEPVYLGSGWRLWLTDAGFQPGGDPREGVYGHFVRHSPLSGTAEYIVTGVGDMICSLHPGTNSYVFYELPRAGSLSALVPGFDDSGLPSSPINADGTFTLPGREVWDKMNKAVEADKAAAFSAFINEGATVDITNACLVVEPVLICKTIDGTGWQVALGVRDLVALTGTALTQCGGKSDDNCANSKMVGFTNVNGMGSLFDLVKWGYINHILHGGSAENARTSKALYFAQPAYQPTGYEAPVPNKINDKWIGINVSPNTNGFYVFGAGVSGGKPGKVGAAYTLYYGGSYADNATIDEAYSAMNIVSKDDAGTVVYNENNPSDENPGSSGLKSISRVNNNAVIPKEEEAKVAGSEVKKVTTGESDWASRLGSYINVVAGVQSLPVAETKDGVTSNIVSSVFNASGLMKGVALKSVGTAVSGSNINAGNYYTLRMQDDSDIGNLVPTETDKLKSSSSVFVASEASEEVSESGNYKGDMSNIGTNFALEAIASCEGTGDNAADGFKSISQEKYAADAGTSMGVSVTVMAKKKTVTSYIAYASVDRSSGGITYIGNDSVSYDVSEDGTFTVPSSMDGSCVYAIVRNDKGYSLENDRTGSSIFQGVNKEAENEAAIKEVFDGRGTPVEQFGYTVADHTISLGTPDDSRGTGYSVLVIQFTGDLTRKSELYLKDYELNYVYPSMRPDNRFATLYNLVSYGKTGTHSISRRKQGIRAEAPNCPDVEEDLWTSSPAKTVSATSSYGGNIINRNNTVLAGSNNKNILQNDMYGGIFTTEYNARAGHTFESNLTNVRFTLAVNLVRGDFDPNVTVSTISNQPVDSTYAVQNIGLRYGYVPAGAGGATAYRDSNALINSPKSDVFEWGLTYTASNSVYRQKKIRVATAKCPSHTFRYSYVNKRGKTVRKVATVRCLEFKYDKIAGTRTPASPDGTRVRYEVTEYANKYMTAAMAQASNTTKDLSFIRWPSGATVINMHTADIRSLYRMSVVMASDKNLGFYAEVPMRAYQTSGDTITTRIETSNDSNRLIGTVAGSNVAALTVKVLNEQKRNLKPSSMYSAVLVSSVADLAEGKITSDTMGVGSQQSAVSGGLPVVYAGGDIALNVLPNVKLNMFGYALDLIETSDNTLPGTGNYRTVVADGTNVKAEWGNDASYKPLDDFNAWIRSTLDKLSVDMTLKVDGSGVNKTYNNFTASLGDFGNTDATADGVFSISIKKGAIEDNGGYQALVNSIASDYVVSYDQAKELFRQSDIYKTIIDAVEDCNDSFNTSQTANAIEAGRAHWYDEEVKTFVIRRYVKKDIPIKNIVVNDKVDYGAAPTASTSVGSRTDTSKRAVGKWYMTLFYSSLPDGFTPGSAIYQPVNYGGLTTAYNAGTVLLKEAYISNADFAIPASSTNDIDK